MVKKISIAAMILISIGIVVSFFKEIQDIHAERLISVSDLVYLASEDPVYTHKGEDGQLTGFTIEVLHLAWKEMGFEKGPDVSLFPWSVVYKKILQEERVIGMSAYRTPEREELLQFVCPIMLENIIVLGTKSSSAQINSDEDYKRYKYGTLGSGVSEKKLLDALPVSIAQVTRAKDYPILARMLRDGRVDFIVDSAVILINTWVEQGYPIEELAINKVLAEVTVCLAANNKVPKRLVRKISQALEKVYGSPEYQKLVEKYVPALENAYGSQAYERTVEKNVSTSGSNKE